MNAFILYLCILSCKVEDQKNTYRFRANLVNYTPFNRKGLTIHPKEAFCYTSNEKREECLICDPMLHKETSMCAKYKIIERNISLPRILNRGIYEKHLKKC